MQRNSSRYIGLAILAGTGIGIAAGCLIFNERVRRQVSRKMRRLGRACRDQSAELRDTAGDLLLKSGKGARETGRWVFHRLAG